MQYAMSSCKEFVLDDLVAITAIPIDDVSIGNATWQLTPIIPIGQFSPTLTNAITIGIQPATIGGSIIPIIRKSGKYKDEESDSVAGRLHTVTVTCEADDRDTPVWNLLRKLERTPSHLLLTFRDNTSAFVAATKDTYLCTVEREGAKTSVNIRVQCRMGIQLIV